MIIKIGDGVRQKIVVFSLDILTTIKITPPVVRGEMYNTKKKIE